MPEPRFRIESQPDGTYAVHDANQSGQEIYRTLITGPAAHAVAKEMVRYFARTRP